MDPWLNHQSLFDKLGLPTYELIGSKESFNVMIQNGDWNVAARRVGQWFAEEIAHLARQRWSVRSLGLGRFKQWQVL